MAADIKTTKMSSRGQITLPKDIREQLHAESGSVFIVKSLDDDTVVLRKLDSEKLLKEFKELREKTGKTSSEEIRQEITEERKND